MIEITEQMKDIIEAAPKDKAHCLLATAAPDGWPHVGPKGSIMVLDRERLAYWDRVGGTTFENLTKNPRVTVYYRNPARRDELPRGSGWRFYGMAEVHKAGKIRDEVMARTPKVELDQDPERKGVAVVIKVERITDVVGTVLQSR